MIMEYSSYASSYTDWSRCQIPMQFSRLHDDRQIVDSQRGACLICL